MATTVPPSRQLDLTGQVTVDFMPIFVGNYSCVYRGTWNRHPVAVKVIRATGEPDSVRRKVIRERTVWAAAIHRNIHPLYGFADDKAFSPFGALISPWCVNGDASQFLGRNGDRMVMAARVDLWSGVLEGVSYLHQRTPCIIHGDLKPGNILIDNFGAPRICDFGLARVFLEEGSTGMTTTSEHTGTTRYLAPELVASESTVYPTTASDIYAVGCLGLEFVFLQKPYANRTNNLRGQIVRDIKAGVPPASTHPDFGWPSQRIWSVILELWRPESLYRPSAFTASHLLRRTPMSLPAAVVQRVIDFMATDYRPMDYEISGPEWILRRTMLTRLCLLSRACWQYTIPLLYRNIRLYLDISPGRLSRLVYSLENSVTNPFPFSTVGTGGYGRFTRFLLIGLPHPSRQPQFPDFRSKHIGALLNRLIELRAVLIRAAPERLPRLGLKAHSLTTLEIQRVSISLLLDEGPILQAISCLQRLCIRECYPREPGPYKPLALFGSYLPNMQDIAISGHSQNLTEDLWEVISLWIMPQLKYLYLSSIPHSMRGYLPMPGSIQTFILLHGTGLQYLTLDLDTSLEFADLVRACTDLRSLSVLFHREDELSALPTDISHSNLETINLQWAGPMVSKEAIANITIFNSRAQMLHLFPKLKNAKVTLDRDTPVSLSIQPGDSYATHRDGSSISKIALPRWFFDDVIGAWDIAPPDMSPVNSTGSFTSL